MGVSFRNQHGCKKKSMCKVNNKDYANEKLKIMRIFNKRELITRL